MMVRKIGVLVAGAALVMTSACGGGGSDRPSASEVSKSLTDGKASFLLGSAGDSLDKKAVDCIAKAIVDSKLSDKAVRALVKGEKNYRGNSADTRALSGLSSEIGKCASSAVSP